MKPGVVFLQDDTFCREFPCEVFYNVMHRLG